MAGLAAGIAFIVVIAIVADSMPGAILSAAFIRAANELDEVKIFREMYPSSNVTVFFNPSCLSCRPPIVDYGYQEGTEYADIRILFREGKTVFVHVSCHNLADENDYATAYGPTPEVTEFPDVAAFLQDPHCP